MLDLTPVGPGRTINDALTTMTRPPIPIGNPRDNTTLFRSLGTGQGVRLLECWEDGVYAYADAVSTADNAALRGRVKVLEDALQADTRTKPDCRTCSHYYVLRETCYYPCTDANNHEPLPPVRLWRTT